MGWSCTAAVAKTLKIWQTLCRASRGSSNEWETPGGRFFFEIDSAEYPDGSATGAVRRMRRDGRVSASHRFRIAPDGTCVDAPMALVDLMAGRAFCAADLDEEPSKVRP